MMRLVIRRKANNDLISLTKKYSAAGSKAARKFAGRVQNVFDLLKISPLIGSLLRDSQGGENYLRFMTVTGYPSMIIIYEPTPSSVEIVRIVNGRRDLDSIISEYN